MTVEELITKLQEQDRSATAAIEIDGQVVNVTEIVWCREVNDYVVLR